MTASVDTNPYVGPRSLAYGEPIYGRDREIDDLTGTLVAQRIVLLYSPSGAGKTSLVEAGVRPRLEARGFHVFPTIRVGHVLGASTANRYGMSTKLSLSEAVPVDQRWEQDRIEAATVAEHLDHVIEATTSADADPCLVFDQFEELFTLDPADWDEKRAFLHELGVALRKRDRWALFAMREDYIAQLDPLLSLLPNRLSARYRLDLLEPDAARVAAVRPAENAGVDFAAEAADHLIDDLRRTRVDRAGLTTTVLGRYVEPVVLQAACRRLWEQAGSQQRINVSDVEALGDVDDALADFCDDRFAGAAAETHVPEQRIRDWVERELITEQGFRSQSATGPGADGPAVLRALEDRHLLRAESRRGTTWYEIPHDRLVSPIQSSNRRWLAANLDAVQAAARAWEDNERSVDMLLRGTLLANAERWLAEHPAEALPVDQAFVDASRAEQRRIDDDKRRGARRVGIVLAGLLVAVSGALIVALVQRSTAQGAREEAEEVAQLRSQDAQARSVEAEEAKAAAAEAQEEAEDAKAAAKEAAERAAAAQEAAETAAAAQEAAETAAAEERAAAEETAAAERAAAKEAADDAGAAAQTAVAEAESAAEAAAAQAATAEAQAAAAEAAEFSVTWNGGYVAEPGFPDIEVRLGHHGRTVGWLQVELLEWAEDHDETGQDLEVDCFFGRVTEEAVKTVQADSGLAETGVADDVLWEALGVDVASPVRDDVPCEEVDLLPA